MTEEFEQLVTSISGEGPSPDFVATLRQRIVAESMTDKAEAEGGIEDVPVLDLLNHKENTMERNGWIVGALVAAAAVVVIGLGAVFFRDDTTVISDQPETTTTAVPAVSEDTIATIEGFLAATDLDTLTVYLTDEAFAGNERVSGSPNASELLVAREILGRETEVVSCIEAGGETIIRCTVSTRSNVTEALGLDPLLSDITFNFTDDLIGTWPSMGWGGFTLSREVAIDAGFREDFDQVCGGDNLVDAECAEFVMANIDSWVGGEALPEE